ncbi:MAG: hypothetical protein RLZZ213_1704 [Cyanobacteriota bacterium]
MIAEQGLPKFVDALLNSDEYRDNFGDNLVPFQRSRVLPGQAVGTMPFNQQAPRYDSYWREAMARRAPAGGLNPWTDGGGWARPAWLEGQPTPRVQAIWQYTVATGGFVLTGLVIWIAAAMLSTG